MKRREGSVPQVRKQRILGIGGRRRSVGLVGRTKVSRNRLLAQGISNGEDPHGEENEQHKLNKAALENPAEETPGGAELFKKRRKGRSEINKRPCSLSKQN